MDQAKTTFARLTRSKQSPEHLVSSFKMLEYALNRLLILTAIRKKDKAAPVPSEAGKTSIMGKDYFRNPEVNEGFYSLKRTGVADVDPKVITSYSC